MKFLIILLHWLKLIFMKNQILYLCYYFDVSASTTTPELHGGGYWDTLLYK